MTDLWLALRRNRLAVAGLAVVLLLVVLGIAGPWITPHDPLAQNLARSLEGPSADHWFGTDSFGRDILSRVLFGARISLLVGVASQAIAFSLGVLLGLVAGYYGGRVEGLVMRLVNEHLADRRLDLMDGVKAYDDRGWVQVLPDPDEPLVHLYAEGSSEELTRELTEEVATFVEAVVQGEAVEQRTLEQASS